MWNLKTSKQNKTELIDTEKRLVVARGMGWMTWVELVKSKLPVIKQISHGGDVWHRDYS